MARCAILLFETSLWGQMFGLWNPGRVQQGAHYNFLKFLVFYLERSDDFER